MLRTRLLLLAPIGFALILLPTCFNPEVPAGLPCSESGRCPDGQSCVAGTCQLPGTETVDAATPDPGPCQSHDDCQGDRICDFDSGQCVPPTCDNSQQGEEETDVDCGGPDCGPCAVGAKCATGRDCTSQVCSPDMTCAAPRCGDAIKNGTEDCDDDGESDTCDADCTTAECGDQTINQTAGETCDPGGETADCDNDCTPQLCGDSVVNRTANEQCDTGGNTDTCDSDCTMVECPDGHVNPAAGEECDDNNTSDLDECLSNCKRPTCTDGAQNFDETDIDCGGHCGATCRAGQNCGDTNDCQVGTCHMGQCTELEAPVTFNATSTGPDGTIQTYSVPLDGVYRIEAIGAEGGNASFPLRQPGCGAKLTGEFTLTAGQELKVLVGQQGLVSGLSASGGGGSFVVDESNNQLVVAGGGGGLSADALVNGVHASADRPGVPGSTRTDYTAPFTTGGTPGSGGGASAGTGSGGGGFDGNGTSDPGGNGEGGQAFVNGGRGGSTFDPCFGDASGGFGGGGSGNGCPGGGGGGGHSGGGGGRVAGGGGSFNSGANQSNTTPECTGSHGRVVITHIGF